MKWLAHLIKILFIEHLVKSPPAWGLVLFYPHFTGEETDCKLIPLGSCALAFLQQCFWKVHAPAYFFPLFFRSLFSCAREHPYLSAHSVQHEESLFCRSAHCHILGKPVGCHIARIFHSYSFFVNLHCSLRVMVLSEHLWLGLSSECSWFLLCLDLKVESCLFRFGNCLKNRREKGIDKGDWFGSCSPTYWSSLPLKQPSI